MNKYIIILLTIYFTRCQLKNEPAMVYYINSYHDGYASSDSILAGIQRVFENSNTELVIYYMDSKRHTEDRFLKEKAIEAMNEIEKIHPDVILVSDDNAVKYIAKPYLKDSEIPVLFCGVNWSARQYSLPSKNITGMLEVLPLNELFSILMKYYPNATSLTVLSENSISERKNKQILDTLYHSAGFTNVSYALVDNFESWREAFVAANDSSDVIYVPTNGAVKNWVKDDAISFVHSSITKPVVTCDDFMMPYAVFGLTKVASEQGEWVASKALEVIQGVEVSEIPLSRNIKVVCWFNRSLSEKTGFKLSSEDFNSCNSIE